MRVNKEEIDDLIEAMIQIKRKIRTKKDAMAIDKVISILDEISWGNDSASEDDYA